MQAQDNQSSNKASVLADLDAVRSMIRRHKFNDLVFASIGYQSIFAAGLVLFVMTLCFNIIGYVVRKKFREQY